MLKLGTSKSAQSGPLIKCSTPDSYYIASR